jgi:hypothetical protein
MGDAGFEREMPKVEEWLFAVLRFAVTREDADRNALLVAAADMDRLGASTGGSDFRFFARTSTELCALILGRQSLDNKATLRHRLGRIQCDRLRRALEAALEIERFAHRTTTMRGQHSEHLWRGLPVRH